MTIQEAIERLEAIAKRHGRETRVYFDCPQCKQSFTPGSTSTVAVHLPPAETGGVR